MPGRVQDKVAIVVGAGQTEGQTIGNGRATAMVLAREGARVVCADRDLKSAEATVAMIEDTGGPSTGSGQATAIALAVDVTIEDSVAKLMADVIARYGRIDILHNNVGASIALGDKPVTEMTMEAYDRMLAVNLKSHWLTCKYAIPHMRQTGGGSIVSISSMAARHEYPLIGYKTTKAAVIALIENVAAANAEYGIRANVILPGKINTPMAIEERVNAGRGTREEIIAMRDKMIPLGRKMGTGWDIANAALFLHSDDASFITGISLVVDGGESVKGGAG
jgi:NAD(P)-dependent dehydrogenase (short-subunit alcohol dehydrogenase family)